MSKTWATLDQCNPWLQTNTHRPQVYLQTAQFLPAPAAKSGASPAEAGHWTAPHQTWEMFCSQIHQYSNAQQILWVYHRDFRNPLKKSPQLPWPNPPPQTFTCGSHKACLSQKKSVYSALAKITKDLQTLTIEQQGYFENSKCCFRCKMKWISPVQQCSHPPT